jgi:hypothetical protein
MYELEAEETDAVEDKDWIFQLLTDQCVEGRECVMLDLG